MAACAQKDISLPDGTKNLNIELLVMVSLWIRTLSHSHDRANVSSAFADMLQLLSLLRKIVTGLPPTPGPAPNTRAVNLRSASAMIVCCISLATPLLIRRLLPVSCWSLVLEKKWADGWSYVRTDHIQRSIELYCQRSDKPRKWLALSKSTLCCFDRHKLFFHHVGK